MSEGQETRKADGKLGEGEAIRTEQPTVRLSEVLAGLRSQMPAEGLTLRELLERVGEQGLLLFGIILNLPFLLPVSIPGVATAFGALIVLIGIGVALDRMPWLPERFMRKKMTAQSLDAALEKGERFFRRVDRLSRPRLPVITHGTTINRLNGAALAFSGFLLVLPLAPIPFSNTFPAAAAMLLSLGMLQRDGVAVLLGYVAIVATLVYFTLLAFGAVAAGQGIGNWLGR